MSIRIGPALVDLLVGVQDGDLGVVDRGVVLVSDRDRDRYVTCQVGKLLGSIASYASGRSTVATGASVASAACGTSGGCGSSGSSVAGCGVSCDLSASVSWTDITARLPIRTATTATIAMAVLTLFKCNPP